jgi:phosphoribosylamine--glycine ligase
LDHYLAHAQTVQPDLTIVGPEVHLVQGIADLFTAAGFRIFGPSKAAAQLEGSKIFSKNFMARHGIPTARFAACSSESDALAALPNFRTPIVIKADGLAAGKGVVIAQSHAEASSTIAAMFAGDLVGDAGHQVLLEEFLPGEEASFIAICDGDSFISLPVTQDHKKIFDNDQGPNTGGMGTYSDDKILTKSEMQTAEQKILLPTLRGMQQEGRPFRGFLFIGLMLTESGPQVLEYNVRLGDPETQSILPRIRSGFVDAIYAATESHLERASLEIAPGASACVVMAAQGYPGKVRTADLIEGIPDAENLGVQVFHAGTQIIDNKLLTSGGRVLGVAAQAASLAPALELAYQGVAKIHFQGAQYRRDIGQKGLGRYTN